MNTIATLIRILAVIIYIGGIISGIVLANIDIPYTYIQGSYSEWSLPIALAYWSGAIYLGTMTLGLAEIITLLQKLVDKSAESTVIVEQKPSDIHPDLPSL